MLRRVLVLISGITLSLVHGSGPVSAAGYKEPAKWYQVELILFAYVAGEKQSNEDWRGEDYLNYPSNMAVLHRYQAPSVLRRAELNPTAAPTGLSNSELYPLAGLFEQSSEITDPEASDIAPVDNEPLDTELFDDYQPVSSESRPTTIGALDENSIGSGASDTVDASAKLDETSPVDNVVDLLPIELGDLPQKLPQPMDLTKDPFIILPRQHLQLTSLKKRVERALDLRLLAHTAWRQPSALKVQARQVLIQAGEQYDMAFELEGSLTISENRYLHVSTDLFFSHFRQQMVNNPIDWSSFSEPKQAYISLKASPVDDPTSVHEAKPSSYGSTIFLRDIMANLKQSRRIKTGELHYLDHPLIGMLVMVKPYHLPDPVLQMENFDIERLPHRRNLPTVLESPDAATPSP